MIDIEDMFELNLVYPPDVQRLIFLGDEGAAAERLHDLVLALPGLGEARVTALMGGYQDPGMLIKWALNLRAIFGTDPEAYLQAQSRQARSLGPIGLERSREEAERWANLMPPARWDRESIRTIRAWVTNYLPHTWDVYREYLGGDLSSY
jgi:hypothetical protein